MPNQMHNHSILLLQNISKTFKNDDNEEKVLKAVNLSVSKGNIISIIGQSGSGKSTLLQIAGLLEDQSGGNIILNGINCNKITDREKTLLRRQYLGFVYQFHHLLPEFTALENLEIPQLISRVSSRDARKTALSMLEALGLLDKTNSLASELSGGQKQRVAIGRSLILQPQLILADEPTGNLDKKNSDIVFEMFIQQIKNHNKSAIIVTHNMDLALKTDEIFILEDGVLSRYIDKQLKHDAADTLIKY